MKVFVHNNSFETDHAYASINCHHAEPGRAAKASTHHLQALVAKHLSVPSRHSDIPKATKATMNSSLSYHHSHNCPFQRHAVGSNTTIDRPTSMRAATVHTSSDRSNTSFDSSVPTLPYYAQAASTLPPPAASSGVLRIGCGKLAVPRGVAGQNRIRVERGNNPALTDIATLRTAPTLQRQPTQKRGRRLSLVT